ncbi:Heme oxygenase 2 [Rhynchospora pubera]|uniref:Heme oxygenase 2 n=1 Tax=Rhynchospora pubera TaxID=906938 RepID=A0AAV8FGM5_9POAL|nr:Heme oxygenase 2 [Rhynchospora pubera]
MLSSLSPCPSPNLLFSNSKPLSLNPNPIRLSFPLHCSNSTTTPTSTSTPATAVPTPSTDEVPQKRWRQRKFYPGEDEGICEEMRFVAMRLRDESAESAESEATEKDDENTWQPSMEGFLKYLVDSKLVFETVERIIDESTNESYAYFRQSGLERTASLTKDIESFKEQGFAIPEPSPPGVSYSTYLKELAESSAPSFLCHRYNIYFAHATGGVGIGKQAFQKLLEERKFEFYNWEGRKLEFYNWDSDPQVLLKDLRDSLNKLSKHWTRNEKNTCLKEATKSFVYLGKIVRLIILL